MTNLQPKQFWYHASNADLTPGEDMIRPSNDPEVGRSNYDYTGGFSAEPDGSHRGDWTFAADTEREAEAWAPTPRTPYGARPTTYVVSPHENADVDFETEHYETGDPYEYGKTLLTGGRIGFPEDRGLHLKAKGPMHIHDRIDIPRPTAEGMTVQGTLPPVHWGMYRPKNFNGDYDPEDRMDETARGVYDNDNSVATWHPEVRRHRERQEAAAWEEQDFERAQYEQRWKKAGQQELDL
jgi:hypothetical protein